MLGRGLPITLKLFQSLRIATDGVKKARSDLDELINEWGRYRGTSLRPPNDEAPSTMHTRRSVVNICRSSTYARNALGLSNYVKKCRRTSEQASWYANEVWWLCRAGAELEYARREVAEADSERARRA